MTTLTETFREARTRSADQMKSAQKQMFTYNERIAETVVGALPKVDRSDRIPSPSEMLDKYFTFVDRVQDANRDFARRVVSAWDRPEDDTTVEDASVDEAPAKKATAKPAAKKTTTSTKRP